MTSSAVNVYQTLAKPVDKKDEDKSPPCTGKLLAPHQLAHEINNLRTGFRGSVRFVSTTITKLIKGGPTTNLSLQDIETLNELNERLTMILHKTNGETFKLVDDIITLTKLSKPTDALIKNLIDKCQETCLLAIKTRDDLKKFSNHLADVSLFLDGMKLCADDLLAVIAPFLSQMSQEKDLSELKPPTSEPKRAIVEFDPLSCIQEVLAIHAAYAQERKVKLAVDENSAKISKLILTAPLFYFKSVVGNLVLDGINATPEGGSVTITLKVVNETTDETTLKVIVRDTGIGMTPETIAQVSKLYYRADTQKQKGYGIGLAMSKEIVENKFKGKFEQPISEGLGKGSSFSFTFTAKHYAFDLVATPSPLKQKKDPLEQKITSSTLLKNRTILIADDSPINLNILKKILENVGATCYVATNGQEAIEMLKLHKPDLILMDIMMPVKTGIEAAAAIRNLGDPLLAKTPIIALTADNTLTEQHLINMQGFLPKPYVKKVIFETILKFLSPLIPNFVLDTTNLVHVSLPPATDATGKWCCKFQSVKAQKVDKAPSLSLAEVVLSLHLPQASINQSIG